MCDRLVAALAELLDNYNCDSGPFIRRPVATTLLTLAMTLSGGLGYLMLRIYKINRSC